MVAGLGTGLALAVLRRRRRRADASPVSHANRTARNARLARLGVRTGGSLAVHRARRVFADAASRERLDHEFELRTAEQVSEALGEMKGALMKLGQMASYLDQGLPDHVRQALTGLQAAAPPMSAELAAGMVRAELGDDPEVVFAEWDPEPLAAASIGQVHRAITHEGQAVAVKVQYPGVAEAMGADLANVGLLFAGMAQVFPGLDHRPLVAELRERLVEELDYRIEARNQQLFADALRGAPHHPRPRVHRPLLDRAGADHRPGRRAPGSTRWSAGPRTSATWRPRRSTASPSAASTTWPSSTATRTRATTCSAPTAT